MRYPSALKTHKWLNNMPENSIDRQETTAQKGWVKWDCEGATSTLGNGVNEICPAGYCQSRRRRRQNFLPNRDVVREHKYPLTKAIFWCAKACLPLLPVLQTSSAFVHSDAAAIFSSLLSSTLFCLLPHIKIQRNIFPDHVKKQLMICYRGRSVLLEETASFQRH